MILIIYSVIFNTILLFSNMRNSLFRYILLLANGGAFAYFSKTEEYSLSIVTLMLIVPLLSLVIIKQNVSFYSAYTRDNRGW